ncbi:hypothetical protein CsSME_00026575 [Camellia sinensis var. sinensis]
MASEHRREHRSSIEIDFIRARIAVLRASYSSRNPFRVRSTRSSSSTIEEATPLFVVIVTDFSNDDYENEIMKCISFREHSRLESSVGDEV